MAIFFCGSASAEPPGFPFFDKDHQPNHLDDALEAVEGALEEYRKAKADFYIEQAESLREKILALMGQL